ncbi:Alpha-1B-glycoprotein [Heterocephalus glaber]|uniref:Alpha-1B-glycoprotein n=1 Tax=Heterocephalus glaber TaxID=10181 RepID=G5B7K8_HETGA|nr:Alpha-1B-glycoprotein [Heterocephalus glaber]
MAAPVGFLLLWGETSGVLLGQQCGQGLTIDTVSTGLTLGPASEAATMVETRPSLCAESALPLKPWARLQLPCRARLATLEFQLLKDGVALEHVRLDFPAIAHQFVLGEVTRDNRGLYHCRAGLGSGWTQLSGLVEVTGTEPLPPPRLSAEPVSWITPGLNSTLRCRAAWHSATFLLRREGDQASPVVAEGGEDGEATFPAEFELRDVSVADSANYSCIYVDPELPFVGSAPSARLQLRVDGPPPAPRLRVLGPPVTPGRDAVLRCEGSVPGVVFELLRAGEEEAVVSASSASAAADLVLTAAGSGHAGNYSCRYRAWGPVAFESPWSDPVELQVAGS